MVATRTPLFDCYSFRPFDPCDCEYAALGRFFIRARFGTSAVVGYGPPESPAESHTMRAVVQRVSRAIVTVDNEVTGAIERGFLVLLGVGADDTQDDVIYLAGKVASLRVFEDDAGKMNRTLDDVGGKMLVVSQFTLLGDCRKGRRPSFIKAAGPEKAGELYRSFVAEIRGQGIEVATGRFQEHMSVELINEGPVTLLLDSQKQF